MVVGCGGVGLSAIRGCRIAGAEHILAIDIYTFFASKHHSVVPTKP